MAVAVAEQDTTLALQILEKSSSQPLVAALSE
jgi:hypothetical protein